MTFISKDLYQFNSYVEPINLTFHQYLLLGNEPLLVHTGNVMQAEALVPELKDVLNGKELKYIFISHFEADECGGLSLILEHFPKAKTICSEVTARQLNGFGIKAEIITKKAEETLNTDNYELEFINYPSEMHLWDGLLVIENKREIFFSSDLMFALGKEIGTIKESDWNAEVNSIKPEQIPDNNKMKDLQETLKKLKPNFIATGHGPCLKLK
ncbi:MBL fold metallo-hydrolase [Clostridium beijerinckii]|uniref:MBL fold metallo-hydrolase n=1 Tax=Clostridium beijerinckii TaxID=1520 RepID=UPI00098C46EB|nr:MBL fold metallo-hydrolase [Clostridium beijerinckii]MBA8937030.1 flavorubredoxin [Clostridium beijerinckii]NOW02988.1 flavorubredoxin [Clostridium beijerinckii]NRU40505.1 flavorubredoxin [Clostridium beijerinckii]NSA96220.1 flavorubredoxin [Clostridium beijerinckii]NYC03871.1 flavorubredoxin [Clostridium beijerinckii]